MNYKKQSNTVLVGAWIIYNKVLLFQGSTGDIFSTWASIATGQWSSNGEEGVDEHPKLIGE